jgi:short chain dehydrogenase
MSLPLDGKIAIITGSAAGLGAAIARQFANDAARVVISEINSEAANETACTIDGAIAIPADVTNEDQGGSLVDRPLPSSAGCTSWFPTQESARRNRSWKHRWPTGAASPRSTSTECSCRFGMRLRPSSHQAADRSSTCRRSRPPPGHHFWLATRHPRLPCVTSPKPRQSNCDHTAFASTHCYRRRRCLGAVRSRRLDPGRRSLRREPGETH